MHGPTSNPVSLPTNKVLPPIPYIQCQYPHQHTYSPSLVHQMQEPLGNLRSRTLMSEIADPWAGMYRRHYQSQPTTDHLSFVVRREFVYAI